MQWMVSDELCCSATRGGGAARGQFKAELEAADAAAVVAERVAAVAVCDDDEDGSISGS